MKVARRKLRVSIPPGSSFRKCLLCSKPPFNTRFELKEVVRIKFISLNLGCS